MHRRAGACELAGLHSHIGSQIFDTAGFEVAAHRVVGLLGQVRDEHGDRAAPSSTSAAASASPTPTRRRPGRRRTTSPRGCARSSTRECAAAGLPVPRLAVEPGRAIAGPGTVTLYEVGTDQAGRLGRRAAGTYVYASTAG